MVVIDRRVKIVVKRNVTEEGEVYKGVQSECER